MKQIVSMNLLIVEVLQDFAVGFTTELVDFHSFVSSTINMNNHDVVRDNSIELAS